VNRYTGAFANYEPNLAPKPVKITVTLDPATQLRTVTIIDGNGGNGEFRAAVEGAYIMISDDNVKVDDPATPYDDRGHANGQVARLGSLKDSTATSVTYYLAPGADLDLVTDAVAFLIGRGYTNPANPALGYSGPSMGIATYVLPVSLP
jgi:hypothetical protein